MSLVVPSYMKLVGVAVVALVVAIGAVAGTLQSQSFNVSGNLAVARDVTALVRMSDVIVAGTVTAVGGTRNVARDPKDPTREDPNMTAIAQDYTLVVDTVIKGNVGSTITVTSAKSTAVRKGPLTAERNNEMFIPLKVGTRYLLLLRSVGWTSGVYAASFEPHHFELGAGATVRSNWSEASSLFPPISTQAFIAALRVEVAAEPR